MLNSTLVEELLQQRDELEQRGREGAMAVTAIDVLLSMVSELDVLEAKMTNDAAKRGPTIHDKRFEEAATKTPPIAHKHKPPARSTGGRLEQYDWERGYELWKGGATFKEIAADLGCSPNSPKNKRARWQARLNKERQETPPPKPTVECPEFTCQQQTRTSPCEHCNTSLPLALVNKLKAS